MNNLVQRINFFSRWLEATLLARDPSAAARSAQSTRSGTAVAEKTPSHGVFRSPDMPRAFWISAFFCPQGKCVLVICQLSRGLYVHSSELAISQSSRGLGLVACSEGQKINNIPNMASRKFSYIPKVICAA